MPCFRVGAACGDLTSPPCSVSLGIYVVMAKTLCGKTTCVFSKEAGDNCCIISTTPPKESEISSIFALVCGGTHQGLPLAEIGVTSWSPELGQKLLVKLTAKNVRVVTVQEVVATRILQN